MKLGLITLMFAALLATPVAAQPKDAGEAAYQEGRRLYDLRDWDGAITKFKEAYKLRSDAPSLFNIAQSYRLKGDCVEALGFYKTYKRNFPTAQNIAAVDKFIVELEPCAKEQAANQNKPPTEPAGEPTKPVGPSPVEPAGPAYEDRGASKRTMGMVIGGAGGALVVTGVVFGILAKGKADTISDADPGDPQPWDPDIEKSGKRYDLIAKITWGVGGAAIIGGTVLYIMGKSAERTQVSVVPAGDGALVGFATKW